MIRLFKSSALLGVAILAAVTLASPSVSVAQNATPESGASAAAGSTISVNGRGTVTISPDSASIVVGVDVTGDTLVETRELAASRMTAVLATVEAAGIPAEQVQTVNYSINVINEWDDQGRLQGVAGYQVSNQVQIRTNDLEGMGQLIDDLVGSGANTIYSINFFKSDATDAYSQARALAVADAQAKATELAAAAGVELGSIVAIVENSLGGGPVADGRVAMYDQAGSGSTPIQSGSLQISIDVVITWAIVG
jgi:uncharacterized protein YggE